MVYQMTLSEKQGDLTEEGKQLAGVRCLVNSRKRSSSLGVSGKMYLVL